MVKKSTWVVIAVLVGLVGLAYYLQTKPDQEAEATSFVQEKVFDFAAGDMKSIQINGPEGHRIGLLKGDDGSWTVTGIEKDGEVDTVKIESMVNQMANMSPQTRLDVIPGLETIGLIDPQYTIKLETLNGLNILMEVGNQTPVSNGYYVRIDNSQIIVVSEFSLSAIMGMVDEPPFLPTPTPELPDNPS